MKPTTDKKATHTPTPWDYRYRNSMIEIFPIDPSSAAWIFQPHPGMPGKECSGMTRSDAEFIVRAVNSHEALLEVAKKAKAFIATTDNYNDGGEPANRLMQELESAIAQTEVRS